MIFYDEERALAFAPSEEDGSSDDDSALDERGLWSDSAETT